MIQEIKRRWVFIGVVKLEELDMDERFYDDEGEVYRGLNVDDSS